MAMTKADGRAVVAAGGGGALGLRSADAEGRFGRRSAGGGEGDGGAFGRRAGDGIFEDCGGICTVLSLLLFFL